ncbi:hypothetical protein LZC34_09990, partial [Campylobacter jejuni]
APANEAADAAMNCRRLMPPGLLLDCFMRFPLGCACRARRAADFSLSAGLLLQYHYSIKNNLHQLVFLYK